jgi:rod shape-determining protein MreC
MSAWKRYRDIALVVIMLVMPLFFLKANMTRVDRLNKIDKAVLRISAPIQYGASAGARSISDVWSNYIYLVDLKAENERLSYENSRLRESNHRLEGFETDNRQLRRLLDLKSLTVHETVSAEVIGKELNEFFRATRVMLDRGNAHVKPHMPVISPDGVVGAIANVAGDSADVQLAVDPGFGIDVEDEQTHARGYVRGTGDPTRYACKVEMVDSRDTVEVNDLLVTTGKGKWFPRGIPVARITKVKQREVGRDQEVEAAPTVNFSKLDSVLILTAPLDDSNKEAKAPEKKGAKN